MIRVAIIGAGPKGLFAAERLAAALGESAAAADVTVFDPQPPGWGAGYRADQPDWLRLNVNAAIVAADGGSLGRPSLGLADFATWRRAQGEADPLDAFPPRALVGRYFADSWRELLRRVPPIVRLRYVARRVERLTPSGDGWLVEGQRYDEVLLCTGHALDWPGALRHGWDGRRPLVPQVYPVTEWLSRATVPAGCTVVCRGAALTFIEAALTLTEGRGGRFAAVGRNRGRFRNPAHAYGYRRSGDEPAQILPVARRGAFLQVKPAPEGPLAALNLAMPRAAGRAACVASDGDVTSVLDAVWQTARDYLAVAGGAGVVGSTGALPLPANDAVQALATSLAVAVGTRPPQPEWALGQAWRDLYPAIVAALSHQSRPATDWQRFADVAAALEPLAFGPPPVNAAKLLALCEAGVVDARYLDGQWAEALQVADVVVDCVLPPPGLVEGEAPSALFESAQLVRGAGRRGVAVAPDAGCLAADGTRIAGLSALGRPTEDVVIGNDTLSRSLHPAAEMWAERVARVASVTEVARGRGAVVMSELANAVTRAAAAGAVVGTAPRAGSEPATMEERI